MKNVLIGCVLLVSSFIIAESLAAAEFAPEPKIFNVTTFGAVGDGIAMDTKPLQDAIDACHMNGGGIVWVPVGLYYIGTIRMKSHVTLSLDHGAILLGSQNLSDYEIGIKADTEGFDTSLIAGEDATDIGFQGLGVIDGRGTRDAFPVRVAGQQQERPKLLILVNCDRVTFSGLTYKNPAFWGCTSPIARTSALTVSPSKADTTMSIMMASTWTGAVTWSSRTAGSTRVTMPCASRARSIRVRTLWCAGAT